MAVGERVLSLREPPVGFSRENVGFLLGQMPNDEIVGVMAERGLSPQVAERLWGAEKNRLRSLPLYHQIFYAEALADLVDLDVIDKDYSMTELACGTGAHLGLVPMKPSEYLGFDAAEPIVAAGNIVLEGLKDRNMLPPQDNYRIIRGDETTISRPRADLALAVLATQYIGVEAFEWAKRNGEAILIGDVAPLDIVVSETDLANGVIPIKTAEGNETGFSWSLTGEPDNTPMGLLIPAFLEVDRERIRTYQHEDDSRKGTINLYPTGDGRYHCYGWTWAPTGEASEEEIRRTVAMRDILIATFRGMDWSCNAVYLLPQKALAEGFNVGVRVHTLNNNEGVSLEVPPALPLGILMRYWREAMGLLERGRLPHIGKGEEFETPGELRGYVGSLLADRTWGRKFQYANPPLITMWTSEKEF